MIMSNTSLNDECDSMLSKKVRYRSSLTEKGNIVLGHYKSQHILSAVKLELTLSTCDRIVLRIKFIHRTSSKFIMENK